MLEKVRISFVRMLRNIAGMNYHQRDFKRSQTNLDGIVNACSDATRSTQRSRIRHVRYTHNPRQVDWPSDVPSSWKNRHPEDY